jgi:dCMP deaminase
MTWDEYFLAIAETVSIKSKDCSTKVGAVVVDDKNRIVSVGYNGFPRGIEDKQERLIDRELKKIWMIHAEENALLFAQRSVEGYTLYTHPFSPCSKCSRLIIQAGIKRVVAPKASEDLLSRWSEELALANTMFEEAGIELVLI